jgi:hypothetical protein
MADAGCRMRDAGCRMQDAGWRGEIVGVTLDLMGAMLSRGVSMPTSLGDEGMAPEKTHVIDD